MRNITTHHDGHGLNDSMTVEADARDEANGCASHHYTISRRLPNGEVSIVWRLDFQRDPRNVEGSRPGITEAVLYAILIDRLEGFQSGPFACRENEEQLAMLRACLASTRARADERAARGVLGRSEK